MRFDISDFRFVSRPGNAIERMLQMRSDLLYFIDRDLEECVADHSTLCKKRQRIPVEIFQKNY